MFLVGVSGIYLFVLAIAVCHKKTQTVRRLRRDPPELSSDEEDDKEFITNLEASRAAEDLENDENDVNGNRSNQMPNEGLDVRDMLMNQIRQIIDTTSRRR